MRTLVFVLLLSLVAGSARAGEFSACPPPGNVPERVLSTIESEASFDFGDLEENVCQKIVDKGVKLCKSQVKAAAKCWKKDTSTVKNIAVKQCNQLEDPGKSECKDFYKGLQDEIDEEVELDRVDGLTECESDFADDLAADCALGIPL